MQQDIFQAISYLRASESLNSYLKKIDENLKSSVHEDLLDFFFLTHMVKIPGGSFLMGETVLKFKSTRKEPLHEVHLKPFYMGDFPITASQWIAISFLPKVKDDLFIDQCLDSPPQTPISGVPKKLAKEFCARLSLFTGKTFRLPTEAEWEYACRAGTYTAFNFGPEPKTEYLNCRFQKTVKKTTIKGTYPPNSWGLYDMHGNVWEWCEDAWHNNYEGAPTDGSARVVARTSPPYGVIRGGCHLDDSYFCVSSSRVMASCYARSAGFRVVCDV